MAPEASYMQHNTILYTLYGHVHVCACIRGSNYAHFARTCSRSESCTLTLRGDQVVVRVRGRSAEQKSEISFNHYLIHKCKQWSVELWVTLYHITSALGLKIHVCVFVCVCTDVSPNFVINSVLHSH